MGPREMSGEINPYPEPPRGTAGQRPRNRAANLGRSLREGTRYDGPYQSEVVWVACERHPCFLKARL